MIPSGLQALMEASAVLQQQASQTAPGPQGQQPTVANQVMQQAQQAAQPTQMPQMQAIGKQAGIAGQLMAQRQQQQQQAAQNPEAIAQMAAQMLQQKGVAALPTNMQFREGGIIGYAGGSSVELEDPEAGLSTAERAERQRREKGSIYDPYYGLPPAIREAMRRDEEARREGRASPESIPVPGPTGTENIPRARSERESIEAEQRVKEQRLRDMRLLQERREARRAGLEAALPQAQQAAAIAGGERALEEYYKPYPPRGEMKATESKFLDPSQEISASMDAADSSIGGIKPASPALPRTGASMDASDASIGAAGGYGIAAALPAALSVAKPDYQKILSETPESPESIARRQEKDKLRRERLGIAQAQEDLSARGIEALGRAKKDREQLLESARSRDTYERLNALFTSMRTLGNEVGNTQRAIQAREEAVVSANLLHEESVLKLKQAQQARQLGLKDQEIQLIDAAEADEKKAQELLRADAKIKAEFAKSVYEAESREMTHARDRANATSLRLAELKQQAQKAEDDRETRRLIGLQARLTSAQDSLTRAKAQVDQQVKNSEAYKAIEPIEKMVAMGAKPTPEQEKKLADFKAGRERLEAATLQRFYAQLDAISKELGLESPAQTGTIKFGASGERI